MFSNGLLARCRAGARVCVNHCGSDSSRKSLYHEGPRPDRRGGAALSSKQETHPMDLPGSKRILVAWIGGVALVLAADVARAAPFSAFSCERREGAGHAGDLNWSTNNYSGFRWISCVVDAPQAYVESVKLNRGNCAILDRGFIEHTFRQGERLEISHACLNPVVIEITANGRTSVIHLK